MKLTVLGSNSRGNCYIVHNDTEALIIEAGVYFDEVLKAIDFKLKKIAGCIVSHKHADHAGYGYIFAKKGIKVYSHIESFREIKHHNFVEIDDTQTFMVGNFKIKAFELEHDVKTYGFFINHPETGNFCFITDTSSVPYDFKGLNHILVEANFDREMIDTNETLYFLRDRSVLNHLSFDACYEFLSRQDMSQVHNIVLLHASDFNADTGAFKNKVMSEYNKNTYFAHRGLEIDLNANPF